MPNINLTTENIASEKNFSVGGGLISMVVAILILGGLYGGLVYMRNSITAETEVIKSEYLKEKTLFLSGGGDEIIDFKNRSDIARKIITENKSLSDALTKIEESMLSTVYANSLSYEKEKGVIALRCTGDSFDTVAKQILSFKNNPYFTGVVFGQSSLNVQNKQPDVVKNDKVDFSLEFKIK